MLFFQILGIYFLLAFHILCLGFLDLLFDFVFKLLITVKPCLFISLKCDSLIRAHSLQTFTSFQFQEVFGLLVSHELALALAFFRRHNLLACLDKLYLFQLLELLQLQVNLFLAWRNGEIYKSFLAGCLCQSAGKAGIHCWITGSQGEDWSFSSTIAVVDALFLKRSVYCFSNRDRGPLRRWRV